MKIEPTIKNQNPTGDKFDKKFNKSISGVNLKDINLTEVDSMLTEKEQSFKSKVWSLPKMEGLVHSDPILSAEYQKMAEDGQETYGYHYNETIMNMLFNKYVTNDEKYRQKYLNAIPVNKKRRDSSGIEQLEKKGKEKMNKKSSQKSEGVTEEEMMNNNFNRDGGGTFDDRKYMNQHINKKYHTLENAQYVDETDSTSSGSYAAAAGYDAKNNVYDNEEDVQIYETTDSQSNGSYVGPFREKGSDHITNKPAWDGGEIVGEGYLTNQKFFKKLYESFGESSMDSINDSLSEHHLEGKEEKIDFILKNGNNEFGDIEMLNSLDDNMIDNIYSKIENEMGVDESNLRRSELRKSKLREDDDENPEADNMKQPQRIFFSYNEALGLANILDNSPVEDEEQVLRNFADNRELSLNQLKYQINTHINSKLKGSESPEYYKLENVITVINDMMDQTTDSKKQDMIDRVKQSKEDEFANKEPNKKMNAAGNKAWNEYNPISKQGSSEANEGVLDGTEQSIVRGNPDSIANGMKGIGGSNMGSGGMGFNNNKMFNENERPSHLKSNGESDHVKFNNQNDLDDFGTSNGGLGGEGGEEIPTDPALTGGHRNSELGKYKKMMPEGNEKLCNNCGGKLDEDGHCRRDEEPVLGKIAGEKGSCKKKNKKDNKATDNKYNIKFRNDNDKKREDSIEKRNNSYDKELGKYKKHMNKLKEMVQGFDINEEKRPSVLVQMDRLQKDNAKNFKNDMKDSNTLEVSDDDITAMGEYENVSDNPYELAEKIEKEKMKQHKFNSFNNKGNSTNENNKEIPKRNPTDEESEEIMLNRGLGMQDIAYDNKPDERFEKRMKTDMGDEIYKQRQEKMDYRAKAPMYNKETQPIEDCDEKNHYNKYVTENKSVSAKYTNEFGRRKIISFNINEAVVSDKPEGVKLSFDGMGNTYSSRLTENVEMRNLMNVYNYYISKGNKVTKVPTGRQALTENVDTQKPINEEVQKMMKLSGYNPSTYVDTSKIKKDAKFNFNK